MMKHFLFLLLFLPFISFGQNYSGDVKVPGKNSAYLFSKAEEWLKENHKSTDNTPYKTDPSTGKLRGSGQFSYIVYSNNVTLKMVTYYNVVITIKDNLYNYSFDNIMIENGRKFPLTMFKTGTTKEGTIELYKNSGQPTPGKKAIETNIDYSTKVVNQVQENLEGVIASLEDKMKS
jgi:hypothetical protein